VTSPYLLHIRSLPPRPRSFLPSFLASPLSYVSLPTALALPPSLVPIYQASSRLMKQRSEVAGRRIDTRVGHGRRCSPVFVMCGVMRVRMTDDARTAARIAGRRCMSGVYLVAVRPLSRKMGLASVTRHHITCHGTPHQKKMSLGIGRDASPYYTHVSMLCMCVRRSISCSNVRSPGAAAPRSRTRTS
jgi:hypothetical protein